MVAALILLLAQDPEALARQLGDDRIEVREQATIDLRKAGVAAARALIGAVARPDAEVAARARALLVEMLDRLPAEEVDRVPALAAERERRRFEAAFAAVVACGAPSLFAREHLVSVKAWADLAALGRGAVPRLIAKLEGERAYHAVLALGLFDDCRAARALETEVERDQRVPHGDPST